MKLLKMLFRYLFSIVNVLSKISSNLYTGPGLVFKIIPTAIALMPMPWVWSILFFLTLYLLAIDTIVSIYVQFCIS